MASIVKGPVRVYADRPFGEASVDIAATAEDVWSLISDINLPARFSNEFQGALWIDVEGPSLGARFVGRNQLGEWHWETMCTIHVYEPMRSFGWVVGDEEDATARWRFDVAPTERGVDLTMWAEMGPGPSGVVSRIRKYPDREAEIIDRRLDMWLANMAATVNGIKELAEAP